MNKTRTACSWTSSITSTKMKNTTNKRSSLFSCLIRSPKTPLPIMLQRALSMRTAPMPLPSISSRWRALTRLSLESTLARMIRKFSISCIPIANLWNSAGKSLIRLCASFSVNSDCLAKHSKSSGWFGNLPLLFTRPILKATIMQMSCFPWPMPLLCYRLMLTIPNRKGRWPAKSLSKIHEDHAHQSRKII